MKLYIIALLLPSISVAQEIPKHTNAISVKSVSFNDIALALTEAGYFIDKKDSALGTIITLPKQNIRVSSNNGNVIIQVRIKDSTAIITGQYNWNVEAKTGFLNNDFRTYETIEKRGMKGSLFLQAFNRLNDFALSFKKEVTYSIVK